MHQFNPISELRMHLFYCFSGEIIRWINSDYFFVFDAALYSHTDYGRGFLYFVAKRSNSQIKSVRIALDFSVIL